jgi:hypothetical protein
MGAYWVPSSRDEGPAPDGDPWVAVILLLIAGFVAGWVWLGYALGVLP